MPVTRSRHSAVVTPHTAHWRQRWVARLCWVLLGAIAGSLRWRWDDHSGFFSQTGPAQAIFCLWHNRLALSMPIHRGYFRKRFPDFRLAAMVSASRDGGLVARILELFGVQPVRGSTSRRGPQALLELTSWAERGYNLAITPDGPRGPCYQIQPGITSLAQLTGLTIIPVSYYLSRKICLRSWDRFQIPLPFATCEVTLGEPVIIPREASDAEREGLRQKLEHDMRRITRD